MTAAARLDKALLHAGQRPAVDTRRQHQAPPQVAQVVGQHAQLQSDLVAPAPLTLTIKGKGGEIAYEGKTKDGMFRLRALAIQLRVTAKRAEALEM